MQHPLRHHLGGLRIVLFACVQRCTTIHKPNVLVFPAVSCPTTSTLGRFSWGASWCPLRSVLACLQRGLLFCVKKHPLFTSLFEHQLPCLVVLCTFIRMLLPVLLLATWDLFTMVAHAADILPPPGQPTRVGTIGAFEIVGQSLVSAQQVRVLSGLQLCLVLTLSSCFLELRIGSTLLTRSKTILRKLKGTRHGHLVGTQPLVAAPWAERGLCPKSGRLTQEVSAPWMQLRTLSARCVVF